MSTQLACCPSITDGSRPKVVHSSSIVLAIGFRVYRVYFYQGISGLMVKLGSTREEEELGADRSLALRHLLHLLLFLSIDWAMRATMPERIALAVIGKCEICSQPASRISSSGRTCTERRRVQIIPMFKWCARCQTDPKPNRSRGCVLACGCGSRIPAFSRDSSSCCSTKSRLVAGLPAPQLQGV